MGKISIFVICNLLSALALGADAIRTSQTLGTADSTILVGRHLSPYSPHVDPDGWLTLTSSYKTSDSAFLILCSVRNVAGILVNQTCSITIDSAKSQIGVSKIRIGVVGKVYVVDILNALDARSLNAIISPLPFYESSQKVSVVLPNGRTSVAAKFRIDCEAANQTCRALLFP